MFNRRTSPGIAIKYIASRWLARILFFYRAEMAAAEGYTTDLIWLPIVDRDMDALPEAAGIAVIATPAGLIKDVAAVSNLRADGARLFANAPPQWLSAVLDAPTLEDAQRWAADSPNFESELTRTLRRS